MTAAPYLLDTVIRRETVLRAIREGCEHRGWMLVAAHVRVNHVHMVVDGSCAPEMIMNALKSYGSRALNGIEPACSRWTRHGSTRWMWTADEITQAVRYVVSEQGVRMAVYVR